MTTEESLFEEAGVWIRPPKIVKESDVPHLNDELAVELNRVVDDLKHHLFMIDSLLARYKEALAHLQPLAAGRIDIKYWAGYLPGRHPVAVAYRCLGRGRVLPLKKGEKKDRSQSLSKRTSNRLVYAPFRLKRENLVKRAKRSGKFRESLAQVKSVLSHVDQLLDMRATVVENVRRFRISLSVAMGQQNEAMQRMSAQLDGAMPNWAAFAESRYDELSDRRRDHIELLEQEEKRQTRRGYTFGKKPGNGDA